LVEAGLAVQIVELPQGPPVSNTPEVVEAAAVVVRVAEQAAPVLSLSDIPVMFNFSLAARFQ
jgi:hypothetical protein